MHIRHVMLREFKQGNNDTEAAEKYVVCMVRTPGSAKLVVKFRSGDTSLQDEPRPERSSDFDAEALT